MKPGGIGGAALGVVLAVAAAAPPAISAEPLRGLISRLSVANPHVAAWVGLDRNDEYWRGIAYGLTDEARTAGIELAHQRMADPADGLDGQIAQLNEVAALKPTIVFLSPVEAEGFAAALEELHAAGTRVVVVGAPVRWGPVAVAVLQDQTKVGARMAQYICAMDAEARIATIPGPADQVWNQQRFDGFRNEIAGACPAARLFGNRYRLEVSVPHGQVQAADLAIKYPQANFVYVAAGVLAVGAAKVRQRLRHGAAIVTAGLTREGVAAISAGHIDMAVSVPGVLIGRLAVQYAIRSVEKKSLPGTVSGPYPYPTVFAPNVSITRDLLQEYDIESYDLAPEGWTPPAG